MIPVYYNAQIYNSVFRLYDILWYPLFINESMALTDYYFTLLFNLNPVFIILLFLNSVYLLILGIIIGELFKHILKNRDIY